MLQLVRSVEAGRSLTPRELEIARLVAEGLNPKQICARLGIRRGTLACHLRAAYNKLNVNSLAGLTRWYLLTYQTAPAA